MLRNDIDKISTKKNNIYILDYKSKNEIIENIRGVSGIFYQLNLNNLKELKKYITKKCQTVSYYGFTKHELEQFMLNSNLTGIDRIVPIGNALGIDFAWDGYDIIKTLSRIVSVI